MGTDMRVIVGRVSNLASDSLPKLPELVSSGSIKREDVTLYFYSDVEVENPHKPTRCYGLFGLLANVRNYLRIKPITDLETLEQRTKPLLAWIYDEYCKVEPNPKQSEEYLWDIGVDQWRRLFYTTEELTSFDYDRVMQVALQDKYSSNPKYEPHPEGGTYRQHILPPWFEFLDMLKREKWDFVIISFG